MDNDRVATFNQNGILSLWKLPDCQREYEFNNVPRELGMFPTFTVEGAAVVLPNGSLFQFAEGKMLGQLADFQEGSVRCAAVSPDGSRLAASKITDGNSELIVWDLATGRKLSSLVEEPGRSPTRVWCAENYFLEPGNYRNEAKGQYENVFFIKDCATGRFVWLYNNSSICNPIVALGRTWLVLSARQDSVLLGLYLPDPESLKVINQNISAVGKPVIGPGSTVALDLQLPGPQQDRENYLQNVRAALLERLKKGRLTVGENPQFTLHATTGEGEEVHYGKGLLGNMSPFTVRALRCTLVWTDAQGQVLWKRYMDFAPTQVHQDEGNPADSVRKEMWRMAKSFLSGDQLAVVVFPMTAAGEGQDANVNVLGKAAIAATGEVTISQ